MTDRITKDNPLAPYFVLYDKKTNKPILDPCFSEWVIMFVCGHEKSHFDKQYKIKDQYCDECAAMRDVRTFEFKGVKPSQIDKNRPYEIQIHLMEWDCEAKQGRYVLQRPKLMSNGKYIAHIDHWAARYYGTFTGEEIDKAAELKADKVADIATAEYSDKKALTVFEVPEYSLGVPDVVEQLKRYLQIPDVEAYAMTAPKRRNNDGTIKWKRVRKLDRSKLVIPEARQIK